MLDRLIKSHLLRRLSEVVQILDTFRHLAGLQLGIMLISYSRNSVKHDIIQHMSIMQHVSIKRPLQQSVVMTNSRVKRPGRTRGDKAGLGGHTGLAVAIVAQAYSDLNTKRYREGALFFFGSTFYQRLVDGLGLPPDSLPEGLAFEELPS